MTLAASPSWSRPPSARLLAASPGLSTWTCQVMCSTGTWTQPTCAGRGPELGRQRPLGDPQLVERALSLLEQSERPILIAGSGVLWSEAAAELQTWVEKAGIPLWTTPQGRGAVPEDHPLCFLNARATAFRETDLVMVLGTRLNYVIDFGRPPRLAEGARMVQIDIDPHELARTRDVDVAIAG